MRVKNNLNLNCGDMVTIISDNSLCDSGLIIAFNNNNPVILKKTDILENKYNPIEVSADSVNHVLYNINISELLCDKMKEHLIETGKKIYIENLNELVYPPFISLFIEDDSLGFAEVCNLIKKASQDFLNTNTGHKFLSAEHEFNFCDFYHYIPNTICEKYGFRITKVCEVMQSKPIGSIDFFKNIVDEQDYLNKMDDYDNYE